VSRISVRHRLVNLLGGVLIAAVTICGAAPAQAATSLSTRDSADAAAGRLARQMTGGERFEAEIGGVDLISRLRGLQQPAGRFSDRSPFGDFSNIFTQSFALLALDRAAAGASPASSSFLVAARFAGVVVVPGRRALRRRRIPTAVRPADVRQRGRHHRDGGASPHRRGPARRRDREPSVAGLRAARRRRVRGAQRHQYGACRTGPARRGAASPPIRSGVARL